MKKPKPTTRVGLKWRAGRPRWEPSPANRKAGIPGRDLKDGERWLEHGEALDVCAARTSAAAVLRDALAGDELAIATIKKAVDRLKASDAPRTDVERLRRHYTADLVDRAAALAGGQGEAFSTPRVPIARTCAHLVDEYFADPELRDPVHGLSPVTLRNYKVQSKRFVQKFGDRPVAGITKGDLRGWYLELCKTNSLSVAKLVLGTAAAFLSWAALHDWIAATPATKLRLKKPPGRRVFWRPEHEQGFVAWCDEHDYEDVADAAVLGLWTGANSIDMCPVNIEDLKGSVWSYVRHKTAKKTGRSAMPGILQPVKDRLARPRRVETIDGAFLVTPDGARHTPKTLGDRFRPARAAAVAAGAVPADFLERMLKDTRKTCLTRLWLSGIDPTQIFPWTGHSPDEAAEILREHYLVLQEEGSRAMAEKLEAWAKKGGLVL